MTHTEFLLRKCEAFWSTGQRLPLDLFAQCVSAGIDVDACERPYMEGQHG